MKNINERQPKIICLDYLTSTFLWPLYLFIMLFKVMGWENSIWSLVDRTLGNTWECFFFKKSTLPLVYICLHWGWENRNINKQIYLQDAEDLDILSLCIWQHVMVNVSWHMYGDQRSAFRSWFSPPWMREPWLFPLVR